MASSHGSPAASFGRRRWSFIVEGFQVQYLLTQLAWVAVGLVVFGAAVLTPVVWPLLRESRGSDPAAASTLLVLHERFWLPLLAFFLGLSFVLARETHKVAGPLYRFRQVFRRVAEGDVSMRVKVRGTDYLIKEAQELDAMVVALRERLVGVEGAVLRLRAGLPVIAGDDVAAQLKTLEFHRALDEVETALSAFTTGQRQPTAHGPSIRSDDAGFSLVELVIALAIVATVAAIGLPAYAAALDQARVAGAIGDINAIGKDVAMFQLNNGCLPASLADVGLGALNDPWGRPYAYNVARRPGPPGGGGGGRGGRGGGGGSCGACAGACVGPGAARKDKNLVPINGDFDLYSLGKDGQSAAPLTAGISRDDVIRARDGGFVGLARDY